MFADDSTFVMSEESLVDLEQKANNELPKIYEWFCVNRLAVNVKKSNFMVFTPNLSNSPKLNITLLSHDGTASPIEQIPNQLGVNSFKLLGVRIDEKLTIKDHITQVCKNISKSLFFLSRVKMCYLYTVENNFIFLTFTLILYIAFLYCLWLIKQIYHG